MPSKRNSESSQHPDVHDQDGISGSSTARSTPVKKEDKDRHIPDVPGRDGISDSSAARSTPVKKEEEDEYMHTGDTTESDTSSRASASSSMRIFGFNLNELKSSLPARSARSASFKEDKLFPNEASYLAALPKPEKKKSDCPEDDSGKRIWVDKITSALNSVSDGRKVAFPSRGPFSKTDIEMKAWEMFIDCRNGFEGGRDTEFDTWSEQMDATILSLRKTSFLIIRNIETDLAEKAFNLPVPVTKDVGCIQIDTKGPDLVAIVYYKE